MNKSDNFLSNLGLAKKANALLTGELLFKNLAKVKLLILATDASQKTKERVYKKAHFYNLSVVEKYSSKELSSAMSLSNRMSIGITDSNFAKMLNID
jgi:ribosomal protein L7Ae-like RNA K-turn-binding protein